MRCNCVSILCPLTCETHRAAEDALEFAARALRQYSIGSQDWSRLLGEHKAYAMGKHGVPLHMYKRCAERWHCHGRPQVPDASIPTSTLALILTCQPKFVLWTARLF